MSHASQGGKARPTHGPLPRWFPCDADSNLEANILYCSMSACVCTGERSRRVLECISVVDESAQSPFCERGCSVTVSHGTDSSVFRHAFLVAQCSLCAAWAQIIFRAPLAGWAIMWHIFFIAQENFLIIHLLSSTNTFYLVSPYSLFSGGL